MSLPTSVVITGCESLQILQQAIDAARSYQPLGPADIARLLAKTAPAATKGEFERYKTSHDFDGTFTIRNGWARAHTVILRAAQDLCSSVRKHHLLPPRCQ